MTVLVLWAVPRTVSTAFERMMIERGDHVVLDEPWSRAYYFGPDRRSPRYPLVFPESTYEAVTAGVAASGVDRAVFVKDMAYHALPGLTDDALTAMVSTFLVRRPESALPSLHRRWPDFTDEEAGYTAQRAVFDRVADLTGAVPAVVDSDDLRSDPEGVVAAWCDHVGIDHLPASLTWTPGPQPEWQLWRDWYRTAAASTGFSPPTRRARGVGGDGRDGGELSERLADAVAAARPHYEHLRRHALTAG